MKFRLSLPNTEENLYICKKSANNKVKYMILEFCVSNLTILRGHYAKGIPFGT